MRSLERLGWGVFFLLGGLVLMWQGMWAGALAALLGLYDIYKSIQ